jgi:hypothetical protein
LALVVVAAVLNMNGSSQTSELFEYAHVGAHSDDYGGTVEPATLNDDQAIFEWNRSLPHDRI